MTLRRLYGLFPFALALLLPSVAGAQATDFTFEGTTRDQQGNTLYQEHHRVSGTCEDGSWRPRRQEVEYLRQGEDSAFANKTLVYPEIFIRPEVDFRQPDFNETLLVQFANDQEVVRIKWALADCPLLP